MNWEYNLLETMGILGGISGTIALLVYGWGFFKWLRGLLQAARRGYRASAKGFGEVLAEKPSLIPAFLGSMLAFSVGIITFACWVLLLLYALKQSSALSAPLMALLIAATIAAFVNAMVWFHISSSLQHAFDLILSESEK